MGKPAVILVVRIKVASAKPGRADLARLLGAHQRRRAVDTESPRGTLKRFHPPITES